MQHLPVDTLHHVASFIGLKDFISLNQVSNQFSNGLLYSWYAWHDQYLNFMKGEMRDVSKRGKLQRKMHTLLSKDEAILCKMKKRDDSQTLLQSVKAQLILLVAQRMERTVREESKRLQQAPNFLDSSILLLDRLKVFPMSMRRQIVGTELSTILNALIYWFLNDHYRYKRSQGWQVFVQIFVTRLELLAQFSNSRFVRSLFDHIHRVFMVRDEAIIRCVLNTGFKLLPTLDQRAIASCEAIVFKEFREQCDTTLIQCLKGVPDFVDALRRKALKSKHFYLPMNYLVEISKEFNLELVASFNYSLIRSISCAQMHGHIERALQIRSQSVPLGFDNVIGAAINVRSNSKGTLNLVETLLKYGYNPNARHKDRHLVVDKLILNQNATVEKLQLLFDYGARFEYGLTFNATYSCDLSRFREITEALLRAGATIDQFDPNNCNALRAIFLNSFMPDSQRSEMISYLLGLHSDIHVKDNNGDDFLSWYSHLHPDLEPYLRTSNIKLLTLFGIDWKE